MSRPPAMFEMDELRRAKAVMDAKAAAAVTFLNEQSDAYDANVYALISGGDDSLTNTLVTVQAKRFTACVHLDTGIGIPETQEFVVETCRQQGWPLLIYRAVDRGQHYDDLVMERGFPGPAMHYKMYNRLKERPLGTFIRENKRTRHDRLILSTGARSSESERRMGHVTPVKRDGVKVWMNPIHDWTKSECLDYIEASGVPRSPVVQLIHKSGECLCGSFAKPDELKEIALWYPHVGKRISDLEARCVAAGVSACKWGQRPPKKGKTRKDSAGRVSALCQQCELDWSEVTA